MCPFQAFSQISAELVPGPRIHPFSPELVVITKFEPFGHVFGQTHMYVPFPSGSNDLGRICPGRFRFSSHVIGSYDRVSRYTKVVNSPGPSRIQFFPVFTHFGSNAPMCVLSKRFHRYRPNLSRDPVFIRSTRLLPELVVFTILSCSATFLSKLPVCVPFPSVSTDGSRTCPMTRYSPVAHGSHQHLSFSTFFRCWAMSCPNYHVPSSTWFSPKT